jgi:CDP-diacylglycerol--serine O-phosphatidyltransferase
LLYTLAMAFLMVSRLPVFSGKKHGRRVPPEMVPLIFVGVVVFFGVLVSYPWAVLTLGTLAYLASLPFGWMSYREHERKAAEGAVSPLANSVETGALPAGAAPGAPAPADDQDPDLPTRH